MADTDLQIIIKLQADAAEKALTALKNQLAGLGKTSENTTQSTQKVSKSLLAASRSVAKARVSVVQYQQALSKSAKEALRARNSVTVWHKAVTAGLNVVKQMVTRLKQYNTAQRQTAATAKGATAAVSGLGVVLRRVLVFLGGFLIIRRVVGVLADFGQAMSTVKAVTSATTEEFTTLEKEAKRLGATTRFTATQAAEGMVQLGRAGFTTSQILSSVNETLLLAQAGALDLATASKIVAGTMKGFSQSGVTAMQVVNIFAKAANSANTDVTALGEAIKLSGAVASGMGVSLEETTGALQILADNMLAGSMGGTGLRGVLARLSSVAVKMGVDVKEVDVRTVGLANAIEALRKKGIGAQKALELFGLRAGPAFVVLSKNIPKVREATEGLTDLDNYAKGVAYTMDQNLNGALLKVKSALEAIVLSLLETDGAGGELVYTVEALAAGIRSLTDDAAGFGDVLSTGIRAAAFVVAGLVDTFRGLKMVWEALQIAWGFLAEAVHKGIRMVKAGVEGWKLIFKELEFVWVTLKEKFTEVVDFLSRKLGDVLHSVRDTLTAINQLADVAVPDALIQSLAETEAALKSGKDAALEEIKVKKAAINDEIALITARGKALLENKSVEERFAAAFRKEAKARLDALVEQKSALEETGALFAAFDKKREFELKKLEQRKKVMTVLDLLGVNVEASPASLNPALSLDSDAQRAALKQAMEDERLAQEERKKIQIKGAKDRLKELQTEHGAKQFLQELEIASAQSVSDRLAAADQMANDEVVRRFAERFEKLNVLKAQGLVNDEQYLEAYTQLWAGKEKELADLQIKERERVWSATSMALESAEGAFAALYEATGKKSKEMFYAQKAISIALTLMRTYEAAQTAFQKGQESASGAAGTVLGVTMAALATAQGLARVALIRQQSLAEGGEVDGFSPHSKADNIQASLTAGEYVHPVSAVQYYGRGLMEAIRTKAIPKSAMVGFSSPTRPPSQRFRFQAGGAVARGVQNATRDAVGAQQPIIINNIRDPQEAEQLIQSQPGQDSVWNVIASNPHKLNQIMKQG